MLDSGIVETARWQAREFEKHTGIRCKVSSNTAECDPGRAQTTALYRILQEALTNIAKHAGATDADFKTQLLRDPEVARHLSKAELEKIREQIQNLE